MNYMTWADLVLGALTVWREVRNESLNCKRAVAYVLLTRAEQERWGGDTIMEVVTAPKQFTSMTYPGDPQLTRFPKPSDARWVACMDAMMDVNLDAYPNPMPGADSYHDTSIETPKSWAGKEYLGQIDRIKFFKTPEEAVNHG